MPRFKIFIVIFFLTATAFVLGWLSKNYWPNYSKTQSEPLSSQITKKPLEKYTIENLSQVVFKAGEIKIEEALGENENFNSYLFSFEFSPNLDLKNNKKTTGLLAVPKEEGKYPIILMIRGYVDQQIYTTGTGTKRAGEYFAKNGFITIAPDFLGYADSDSEAENIFETRFQTYVTILNILSSLENIESWDGQNVLLWAHSNGGQIALTVLEITQKAYPTVLWAPVSKPFPYSILYYTDEAEDKGKFIRSELSKFETDYDVKKYSLDNYLSNITAPIQIHQGTADDAVPLAWSQSLYNQLKKLYEEKEDENDLELFTYLGADHNLTPGWETAVQRSLMFFQKHLTD